MYDKLEMTKFIHLYVYVKEERREKGIKLFSVVFTFYVVALIVEMDSVLIDVDYVDFDFDFVFVLLVDIAVEIVVDIVVFDCFVVRNGYFVVVLIVDEDEKKKEKEKGEMA